MIVVDLSLVQTRRTAPTTSIDSRNRINKRGRPFPCISRMSTAKTNKITHFKQRPHRFDSVCHLGRAGNRHPVFCLSTYSAYGRGPDRNYDLAWTAFCFCSTYSSSNNFVLTPRFICLFIRSFEISRYRHYLLVCRARDPLADRLAPPPRIGPILGRSVLRVSSLVGDRLSQGRPSRLGY